MCKCEWCNNTKIKAKGYCNKHYQQLLHKGKLYRTKYDPNQIIVQSNKAIIVLRCKKQNVIGNAIIDIEDIPLIKGVKFHLEINKKNTYCRGLINNKKISLHHIIFFHYNGYKNGCMIDHKNGDGLDNRKCNLRCATNMQNSWNSKMKSTNSSGYKGVSWNNKKWRSRIKCNGKEIHLGYFIDKIDAAKAYNEAAKQYFGEFARLNKV